MGSKYGAKERRAKALTMRINGYSPSEIREKLGYATVKYTRDQIRQASQESFAQEDKQEAVGLELNRLDIAVRNALRIIQDPHAEDRDRAKAIDSLVKVSQRRASFMGLDFSRDEQADNDVDSWLIHITGTKLSTPEPDDDPEDDGTEDEPDDLEDDE